MITRTYFIMQWPFRRRFDVVNKRLGIEWALLDWRVGECQSRILIHFFLSHHVVVKIQ